MLKPRLIPHTPKETDPDGFLGYTVKIKREIVSDYIDTFEKDYNSTQLFRLKNAVTYFPKLAYNADAYEYMI